MKKFLIGIVVLMIIAIAAGLVSFLKKYTAASLAKEYVEQKYGFEAEVKGVRFSWVDPCQYYVFLKQGEPPLAFTVIVNQNLYIAEERLSHGYIYVPDNYIYAWFDYLAGEYFETYFDSLPYIESAGIFEHDPPLYSHKYSENISIDDDIEVFLRDADYALCIEVGDAERSNVEVIAKEILELMAGHSFYPKEIRIEETGGEVIYLDYSL